MSETVIDKNQLPAIIRGFRELDNWETEVGIFGAPAENKVGDSKISMLELAVILHEGINIKVTPKMRGYLASKGLFLKKKTTHIKIPARPFLDPAMESAAEVVVDTLLSAINATIDQGKSMSGRVTWERVGRYVVALIQQAMVDLREPANHPFTIKMKGSDNPLIDHGHLLRGVIEETRHK